MNEEGNKKRNPLAEQAQKLIDQYFQDENEIVETPHQNFEMEQQNEDLENSPIKEKQDEMENQQPIQQETDEFEDFLDDFMNEAFHPGHHPHVWPKNFLKTPQDLFQFSKDPFFTGSQSQFSQPQQFINFENEFNSDPFFNQQPQQNYPSQQKKQQPQNVQLQKQEQKIPYNKQNLQNALHKFQERVHNNPQQLQQQQQSHQLQYPQYPFHQQPFQNPYYQNEYNKRLNEINFMIQRFQEDFHQPFRAQHYPYYSPHDQVMHQQPIYQQQQAYPQQLQQHIIQQKPQQQQRSKRPPKNIIDSTSSQTHTITTKDKQGNPVKKEFTQTTMNKGGNKVEVTKQSHIQDGKVKSKVHHKVTDKGGKVLSEQVHHEEVPHNVVQYEGAVIQDEDDDGKKKPEIQENNAGKTD